MRLKIAQYQIKYFKGMESDGIHTGLSTGDDDFNEPYVEGYTKSANWFIRETLKEESRK